MKSATLPRIPPPGKGAASPSTSPSAQSARLERENELMAERLAQLKASMKDSAQHRASLWGAGQGAKGGAAGAWARRKRYAGLTQAGGCGVVWCAAVVMRDYSLKIPVY